MKEVTVISVTATVDPSLGNGPEGVQDSVAATDLTDGPAEGSKGREAGRPAQAGTQHHVHSRLDRQRGRGERGGPAARKDFCSPAPSSPGTLGPGLGRQRARCEPHTKVNAVLRTVPESGLGVGTADRQGRDRVGPRVTTRGGTRTRTRPQRLTSRISSNQLPLGLGGCRGARRRCTDRGDPEPFQGKLNLSDGGRQVSLTVHAPSMHASEGGEAVLAGQAEEKKRRPKKGRAQEENQRGEPAGKRPKSGRHS